MNQCFRLPTLGALRRSWGALGGPLGGPRLPPGTPGGSPGRLGAVLGGPLGDLGAALGGRGAPSESTSGKQAALQNGLFYFINLYVLAFKGVAGAP